MSMTTGIMTSVVAAITTFNESALGWLQLVEDALQPGARLCAERLKVRHRGSLSFT